MKQTHVPHHPASAGDKHDEHPGGCVPFFVGIAERSPDNQEKTASNISYQHPTQNISPVKKVIHESSQIVRNFKGKATRRAELIGLHNTRQNLCCKYPINSLGMYNILIVIQLLLTYRYIILIPLSIIEGPIITVVCGFLVTLGFFNPLAVYVVMVLGDIIGDAGIYYIGYKGKRFLKYFRVTDEKLEKAKRYFENNRKKALFASKLAHGIGFTGLIAAGASHTSYKKYFITCGTISVIQSLIMLMIGILFGHAYVIIGKYLDYYAAIVSILVVGIILFFVIRKYKIGIKIKTNL